MKYNIYTLSIYFRLGTNIILPALGTLARDLCSILTLSVLIEVSRYLPSCSRHSTCTLPPASRIWRRAHRTKCHIKHITVCCTTKHLCTVGEREVKNVPALSDGLVLTNSDKTILRGLFLCNWKIIYCLGESYIVNGHY